MAFLLERMMKNPYLIGNTLERRFCSSASLTSFS